MSMPRRRSPTTPVVATDAGDIPSLVDDGETGFVVPRGEPEALALRIGTLIRNRGLCERMSLAARVKAEAESTLTEPAPGADQINGMDYTRQVFNEALRLYPPTWIIVRVANQEDALPGGARIQSGDKLYLCPYTMHRHPRYYPEPDRFDPDRFIPEAISGRPKFTFYPFGGGPKLCIGEPLARLEAISIIGRTIQRFGFESVGEINITPRASIVLEPKHGLPVRLCVAKD